MPDEFEVLRSDVVVEAAASEVVIDERAASWNLLDARVSHVFVSESMLDLADSRR